MHALLPATALNTSSINPMRRQVPVRPDRITPVIRKVRTRTTTVATAPAPTTPPTTA